MNILKQSFKYFKKKYHVFILFILAGIIGDLLWQFIPQVLQLVVDYILTPIFTGERPVSQSYIAPVLNPFIQAYPNDYWGLLLRLGLILFCLSAARWLLHYFRWEAVQRAAVGCQRRLRNDIYMRMVTQNSTVLNKYTAGELLSVSNGDPLAIHDFYVSHMPNLIQSFFVVVMSAVFLININPYLAIAPAAIGLLMAFISRVYVKKMRVIFNDVRTASIELNSCVTENINGVRVVRAFAREDYELKKFDGKNESYKEALFKHAKTWSKYQSVFGALVQVINFSSIILGAVFALMPAASPLHITAGEFITFMAYVFNISGPINNMANIMGSIQQSAISANRVYTFLNTYNAIKDPENPAPVADKPALEMKNVTLQLDDKILLKDINLSIPYGKKLGIMGRTGSGKSALIKTFMRFYETTQGETTAGGVNVKDVSIDALRRKFSYVIQDVFLFSNTVDSNIAFYDPDGSDEKVFAAARVAQADDFIQKLPQGYKTIVGEKGLGLSGGQKQRVSIARALFKDGDVIVLDDCTSALDMETERRIFKGIAETYGDRTLIIAAHRASSVMGCDEIVYLEDGAIVERGTYAELMELNGRYADVFNKQAAAYNSEL